MLDLPFQCRLLALAAAVTVAVTMAHAQPLLKPKLLVLTDIGGDPDDQQSMVRLMLYANEFELTGLIATSRMGHGQDTRPELIRQIVEAYAADHANLSQHADGYPPAAQLRPLIKSGTPVYDRDDIANAVGPGKSTEGSDHIVRVVDAATDGRPVNIVIWGGSADLAQALTDVKRTRTEQQTAEFVSRLRVHSIGDQDGGGALIQQQFPALWYIDDGELPGVGQSGPYRGMYQNDARRQRDPSDGVRIAPAEYSDAQKNAWDQLVKEAWVAANVHGHGHLGPLYPTNVWQGPTGPNFPHNGNSGLKEGDTPSWFYFLPNGLSVPDEPGFGGWGGRFEQPQAGRPRFVPATDRHAADPGDAVLSRVWTVARWREAYQQDFQARMDWLTTPARDAANHPPASPLPGLYAYTSLTVRPDRNVTLSGTGWTDPDGDPLSYRWWFYADPSTPGVVPALGDPTGVNLSLHVPAVDQPARLHLILEVTDQPPAELPFMTCYQRVVLMVDPG